MRAGASELQAGEAAAVHEASAAGGTQIVGKTQHLHRTEIHKGIFSDFPEKARQGQFHDVPVVPIPDLRSAEDAQFLSLCWRCPRGKRMVLQRRDRQAEELVRQDGFFIAGQRPQDGNAVILPPHGEPPVCQSADRFQDILLPQGISPLLYLFCILFTIPAAKNTTLPGLCPVMVSVRQGLCSRYSPEAFHIDNSPSGMI